MSWRNTRPRYAVESFALIVGVLALLFSLTAFAATETTSENTPFCLSAHKLIFGDRFSPALKIQPSFQAFVKSKAQIEPLTIHQYVQVSDVDASIPVRISCKFKSPDYLSKLSAGDTAQNIISYNSNSCRDVNRNTFEAVARDILSDGASIALNVQDIIFDDDEVTFFGPNWLAPSLTVYRDMAGTLHVAAKQFLVSRDTIVFFWAPDQWKGNMSCHLVSPELAYRILTGRGEAPTRLE